LGKWCCKADKNSPHAVYALTQYAQKHLGFSLRYNHTPNTARELLLYQELWPSWSLSRFQDLDKMVLVKSLHEQII